MDSSTKTIAEERFKAVVNELIDNDIYPGPTAINDKLYGPFGAGYKPSNHLNGRQTKWRREVMKERDIKLKRPDAALPLTDYDTEPSNYGWY